MGNRIREARDGLGMTIEALAHAAGLSPSYVSRMETSQRNVSLKNLAKLAKALNLADSDLLDEDSAPKPPPPKKDNSEGTLVFVAAHEGLLLGGVSNEIAGKLAAVIREVVVSRLDAPPSEEAVRELVRWEVDKALPRSSRPRP